MKTDRIKVATFGLICASVLLIASITTTTAWFIGSSYLQISSFDITIGSKQIEISPDDENYYLEIDKEQLNKVDYFVPCTSAFSDEWIEQKSRTPEFKTLYDGISSNIMTKSTDAALAETGFFSQDLSIRADADCYALIDPETSFVRADVEKNITVVPSLTGRYPQYTEDEILDNLNAIEKSMRFSILVLGNLDDPNDNTYEYYIFNPFKESDDPEIPDEITEYGGLLDLNSDMYYDFYESTNKEVVYGQVNDSSLIVYDDPTYIDEPLSGEMTCFNAKHAGSVSNFNYEASKEKGFEFIKEPAYGLKEAESKVYIPLKKNKARRIVVSIYIEGWDRDNTNFTMYAGFEMSINFMMRLHVDGE